MKWGLAIALVGLASASGRADIADDEYWAKEQALLDKHVAAASKQCGVAFTFAWVDKPALRAALDGTRYRANGVCGNIVDEVAALCHDGSAETAAVANKIAGFRCGYGKPRSFALDAKVLTYLGNNEEPNFSKTARPWLLHHL